MGRKPKDDIPKQEVTGGPFFFLSLVCLLILGTISFGILPILFSTSSMLHLALFGCGALCGVVIAYYFIRGHIHVFLHELKHSIISNFAGNRAKELKVKAESGHFQYQYSKQSERFNAFISLAPYWVPLFTVPALGLVYLFWRTHHPTMVTIVGLAYGIDFALNMRDLSPIQTDLTLIRGGYLVGMLYVLAMNLTISSFLLAWVMHGPAGIMSILAGLGQVFILLVPAIAKV